MIRCYPVYGKTEVHCENALVTCTHPAAAQAGIDVLRKGGNAIDAAIAIAFALAVVEPFMSGVGGAGQLVIHCAETGENVVVECGAVAPAAASAAMFELSEADGVGLYGWRGVKDDENIVGYRSVAVPGLVAGLAAALDEFGTLTLAEVLEPAIDLAEQGVAVDWYTSAMITVQASSLARFREAAAIFLPNGLPLRPAVVDAADRLVQARLAATLRQIAREGVETLYRGEIAQEIARAVSAGGGILSAEDLASYRPRISRNVQPLTTYRNFEVVGAQLGGAITTAQALNILEHLELGSLAPGSAESLHVLAEALRRSFADRFAYVADELTQNVPFEGLLSKEYALDLAADIDPRVARLDMEPGDPWAYQHGEEGRRRGSSPAGGTYRGATTTTHFCVVDRERNAVSATQTLLSLFGGCVVAGETGIVLNNGMMWFDPQPGFLNSIEPRKRALSAMSPVILLREGRPELLVGAAGGRKVITSVVQAIINIADYGMTAQQAISAPRIHCESPELHVLDRILGDVLDGLGRRGQWVVAREETPITFNFGMPNAIAISADGEVLAGGIDPLKQGVAIGY